MYKKLLVSLLSMTLVASLFYGCAKTEVKNETNSEESEVIMRTGQLTAMNFNADPKNKDERFPMYFYDDLNSMILAFKSGEIDSIYKLPEVVARYIENNIDGVKAVEPSFYNGAISLFIGTLKENTETYNLLNNAIDKLLENGTISKLQDEYLDKYLRTKEEPKPIVMSKIEGAKTLKIAVTGDMPPIDFVSTDGRPAGYNAALLSEISKIANVNIELVQISSAARLTALKTNAVDAVFYAYQVKADNKINERLEKKDIPDEVVITKPYYTSRVFEVDSIKKLDELAAKGMLPSSKTQNGEVLNAGHLPYASTTEEEENVDAKKHGMQVNIKYFDNLNQMLLAMKSGQIDYISLLPKSTSEYIKERNDDIVLYKSAVTNNDRVKYSMATLEDNKEVYNLFNDTLNEIIKDGTIKDIEKKYIDGFIEDKKEPEPVDMPHFDGAKTIKVAVTGDLPPFDFVTVDGRPAGYNVALLSEIANRAKVNIELVSMEEKAKVTALVTENIDAIFWLSSIVFADERNTIHDCPKGVILTDSYYEDYLYEICVKDGKYDKRRSGSK